MVANGESAAGLLLLFTTATRTALLIARYYYYEFYFYLQPITATSCTTFMYSPLLPLYSPLLPLLLTSYYYFYCLYYAYRYGRVKPDVVAFGKDVPGASIQVANAVVQEAGVIGCK